VLILLSKAEDSSFHQHIRLKLKGGSNGMLRFERDFYTAETWAVLELD
jgi:hypothetical protein